MTRTFERLGVSQLGTIALGGQRNPASSPTPTSGVIMPAIQIQVSFTDPFQTPDWVDITRYVEQASTKRGRQHELQRAIAGTLALSVYNQDGRFSTFNSTGPYVNLLSGADSFFQDGSIGTYTGSGCTIAVNSTAGFDSQPALQMTSTSGGAINASTATGTSGYSVTAGKTYTAMASFEAAATPRNCRVDIAWYNGATPNGTTSGTAVTNTTTGYTKCTAIGQAPAGTTNATIILNVLATSGGQVHYVTRAALFTGDKFGNASTGWAPGGRGLVPTRSVRMLATWQGITYPVYQGFVDAWIPAYTGTKSEQTINCVDMFSILSLGYLLNPTYYPNIVKTDSPYLYYRFSETAGNVLNDSSGNGINGAISGSVKFGYLGALLYDTDSALDLTAGGSTAAGSISTPGFTTTGTTNWTFGVWIRTTSTSAQSVFEWVNGIAAGSMYVIALTCSGGNLTLSQGIQGSATPGPSGSTLVTSSKTVSDGNWHYVAVTLTNVSASQGTWGLYVDGSLVGSAVGYYWNGGFYIGSVYYYDAQQALNNTAAWIGQMDEMEVYSSILSSTRVQARYTAGTYFRNVESSGSRTAAVLTIMGIPAAYQNVAVGQSMVQNETSTVTNQQALTYLQTIEKVEQGFGYVDESGVYTFRARSYTWNGISQGTIASDNNSAHMHAESGQIIPEAGSVDLWNTIPVSARANSALGVTGSTQTAENADSAQWYGKRALTGYTSFLMTSDSAALALSQYLVNRYSTPQARVKTARVDSLVSQGAQFPQMLGRKLLDRLTVNWQPLDGTSSPFVQDSYVEQISHTVTPDQWVTDWALTPAEAQNYFKLDDHTYGVLVATGATNSGELAY